jgi:hypothetical protein
MNRLLWNIVAKRGYGYEDYIKSKLLRLSGNFYETGIPFTGPFHDAPSGRITLCGVVYKLINLDFQMYRYAELSIKSHSSFAPPAHLQREKDICMCQFLYCVQCATLIQRCFRKHFVEKFKRRVCATKIQRAWRRAICDPQFLACRKRLFREFHSITLQ